MHRCRRQIEVEYRGDRELDPDFDKNRDSSFERSLDLVGENATQVGLVCDGLNGRGEVAGSDSGVELNAGDRDTKDEFYRANDLDEVLLDWRQLFKQYTSDRPERTYNRRTREFGWHP